MSPVTCSEGSWPSTLSPLGKAAVGSTQGGLVGILDWVLDTTNPDTRGSDTLSLGGTGEGWEDQMKAGQTGTNT